MFFHYKIKGKVLKYAPSRDVHLVGIKLIPLRCTWSLCALDFLLLIYGRFQGMLCALHSNN